MQLNKTTTRTVPPRPMLKPEELKKFSHNLPPHVLLFRARRLLGVSRQMMAAEMGIPQPLLRKFEFGQLRMPSSFLLKIFMFGLDFWTDGICWTANDEKAKKSQAVTQNNRKFKTKKIPQLGDFFGGVTATCYHCPLYF